MSEPRTLRSRKQRDALYEAFGGRCAICGAALGNDWHADHVIPWKVRQETNFYAMQALCVSCNTRKGARVEKGSPMNGTRLQSDINFDPFRPGQATSTEVTLGRIKDRAKFTALVLPTRYGKSDVIRATAIVAHCRGEISYAVVLSPSLVLKKQIVDKRKWRKTVDRYGLPRHTRCQSINGYPPHPRNDSGAFFMSGTLQSLVCNVEMWVQWVRNVIAEKGKPPVIYVDETHMASEKNEWGIAIKALADAGALIVLLTATAVRSDGEDIPGFEYDTANEEEYQYVIRKPGSLPEKVLVEVYQGKRGVRKIRAHHITTFAEAYAESPVPICKLARRVFDVDLVKIQNGLSESLMLSDASESTTRAVLSRVVRDPGVINQAADILVEELRIAKRVDPRAQAIVFVGNDKNETEDNRHAKDVEAAVKALWPELKTVIVTSANSDDGAAELHRFAGNFDVDETADPPESPVEPVGDVLFVKQMAGLGLELAAVKVMLDLSSTRAEATWVQRVMRIATLWMRFKHAMLITPNDVLSAALFQRVTANGLGEVTRIEGEMLHSYEVDRDEPDEKARYVVEGAKAAGFEDSDGHSGTSEDHRLVDEALRRFPVLAAVMSRGEILERCKAKVDEEPQSPEPAEDSQSPNVDDAKAPLLKQCNALAYKLREIRYGAPINWKDEMSRVWDHAKWKAGCRGEQPRDLGIDRLAHLVATLARMVEVEIDEQRA